MSQWTTICHDEQLSSNLGTCALVGSHQVAVFRVGDQFFALDNFDPFSGANVISRGIVGDLQGRVVVASPIYKQHFDLATGQCLEDDDVSLNVFPVRLHDGAIQVMAAPLVSQVA
ncbi:nitrite reductase small subunit NirD [Endozoicomonas sp.]|uniref:nitrite reductase small subunit NirD n=1 Tax=Endozoicomonas sp. TaxID=1892382 RepID=UPI002886EBE6|nr:nitrite reductase small subunit NirD [Endozoicomonas sp.]